MEIKRERKWEWNETSKEKKEENKEEKEEIYENEKKNDNLRKIKKSMIKRKKNI